MIYLVKKERLTAEETIQCPECGSKHLYRDYGRAELLCKDCGLVIDEEFMDRGPEWRAFDSDQREKRERVGAPMTYTIHDKGLSTEIDWSDKDSYGRAIPSRSRAQIYRLRKWQRRIRIADATERNLALALVHLDRMTSAMSSPRAVRETAAIIYRKAVLKNLIRGRSIPGVAAAALYASCRQCNVPRTLDEISAVASLPRKDLGRNYRFLAKELKLKLLPTSPEDYVSRFCNILELSTEVKSKTIEILKKASENKITIGKGPASNAAATIYIASILCSERRTQRDIAEVAGVTEVTVRSRYKEISKKLDLDIIM